VTAVFPGSFDPVTLGHLDLIKRASLLFDVIVAVLHNPAKKPLFTVEERLALLREETASIASVKVEEYSGLLAKFAKDRKIRYILRGVRTEADCAYEIPMAQANRKLEEELETVILVTDPSYGYMSASLIREIAAAGYADGFDDTALNQWVSPNVKEALKKKCSRGK